jgi:hypothetical protein
MFIGDEFFKLSALKFKLETAEGGRFELPIAFTHYDGLANRCLQPLGHPSIDFFFLSANENYLRRMLVPNYSMKFTGLTL